MSNFKYLNHNRDTKFCKSFRSMIASRGIKPIRLPPQSPKMNAFSERFVLPKKSECISGLIFFGEKSLLKALEEYTIHYHQEKNHQRYEFPHKVNSLMYLGRFHFIYRTGTELGLTYRQTIGRVTWWSNGFSSQSGFGDRFFYRP